MRPGPDHVIASHVQLGVIFARNPKAFCACLFLWHFDGQGWVAAPELLAGLEVDGEPLITAVSGHDAGILSVDVGGDGLCELLARGAAVAARFRFEPAQVCDNPYIMDFLARTSLGLTPTERDGDGWSWRFDPDLRAKIRALPTAELLAPVPCRVALLFGDRSKLMTNVRIDLIRRHTPPDAPWIVIPDAGHHIMVDQPLALIAALRSLLEAWQPAAAFAPSFTPSTSSVPA